MRTAVIDADSIIYIIAWHLKDTVIDDFVEYTIKSKCESFFKLLLSEVQADRYIGFISRSDNNTFRHRLYTIKKYKGNRGPKEIWHQNAEPYIRKVLTQDFNIKEVYGMEADDALSLYAELNPNEEHVFCAIDKDIRQLPGLHYDYRKMGPETFITTISKEQAERNFYMQVLTGDISDNVFGLPGIGEVKAGKILDEAEFKSHAVEMKYLAHFGPVYGPRFYQETVDTIGLLTLSSKYAEDIEDFQTQIASWTAIDVAIDDELPELD